VTLRSADPQAAPLIDPGYLSVPTDADVLVHGVRLARQIAATPPLAPFIVDELARGADAQSDEAILEHVRAQSQTLYHPVGTCRLGTDEEAVVDPVLRVRGLDGLRVVDASVIPRLPARPHELADRDGRRARGRADPRRRLTALRDATPAPPPRVPPIDRRRARPPGPRP
jgi:choline dehydrogenase-like flavoprotein